VESFDKEIINMKEDRNHLRAVLRGRTKRYLVAVLAIILALAFSTTALAAKGNGGSAAPAGTDAQSGATSQPPSGGGSSAGGGQTTDRSRAKIGLPNLDKIVAAIAALTDETLKAELTTLLSTYEDAWTAKQDAIAADQKDALAALTDAITTAKATLDAALETAGVSLDTIYGTPVEALDGTGRTYQRPVLDTNAIFEVIGRLPDTNADKSTLLGLLNEYQLALFAQTSANFASLTDQARLELAYRVRHAEEALLLASREAGLIGGNGQVQFLNGYAYGNSELDVTSILTSIAALGDTDENKAKLTELLEAYIAALEAEATADQTALSDAELDALEAAADAAELALIEALELAGIDVPKVLEDVQPRYAAPTYYDDDDDDEYEYEYESEDD
jgi:hypothetical protein